MKTKTNGPAGKASPTLPAVFLVAAALLLQWSCQGSRDRVEPVTAREIERHIRFLADDQLEGRAMGSRGIELAARYQEDYFKTFGLEPAFGASYRQSFPVRGVRPDAKAALEIISKAAVLAPVPADEFVVGTEREDAPAEAAGELVYCGYLIQAPERNWDDVKGADLKGKVLLVEINEPGNRPGGIFDGEDMTYYGRWTAKFEKAAELGAAGVLIIHEAKGAGYGWDVVRNSWSGERFFLPDKNPRLLFQGWVKGETAGAIFDAAHLDRRALLARAETPDFAPVPMGLAVKVRQAPSFRTVEGVNVAGIVRARHPQARKRTIVFSAHYDHLGRDAALQGDQIYNGAADNCTASASLLALAGYFAQKPERLKDDLCFAAVTGEEAGCLGSDYFVRHPPFPKASAVADINLEMLKPWGETEDVFAVGARESELDAVCREAAEKAGFLYTPERDRELGFFFRSDQISFVRAGLPAVWLRQGIVSRGADRDLGRRKFDDYMATKYHRVTDEIQPDWDLRGALQIVRWAEEIITVLQERKDLPQFLPESPFKREGQAPPAAAGQPSPGAASGLRLEYVANCGVLVSVGESKVLVDALFDKPNPEYRSPSPEVLEKMMKGEPPFDGVDLVLVTHNHPDHFDAALAARYVAAFRQVVLLAPADAVAEMKKAAADWSGIEARVVPLDLKVGEKTERSLNGIKISALRTLHSGDRDSPMNIVYLFELGGRRVFHEGDSNGKPDVLRALVPDGARVDLALVHYWFPLEPGCAQWLQTAFTAEHIGLTHLPIRLEGDAPGKIDQVRKYYKDIFLLLPMMTGKVWP